jgi:hypothetical protein
MARITKTSVMKRFEVVGRVLRIPIFREGMEYKGNAFFFLDYNPSYTLPWRMRYKYKEGGQSDIGPRMSTREMYAFLDGMLRVGDIRRLKGK